MVGFHLPLALLNTKLCGSLCLDEIDVLELAAEDAVAVAAEPIVQQRGVDAAEIGVVLQVAGVEVAAGSDACRRRRP